MICVDVKVNDDPEVRAGGGDVLSVILSWVARRSEMLELEVLGLAEDGRAHEHRSWLRRALAVGDEVSIRVVESGRADEPRSRRRYVDPGVSERALREYYERVKKEYEALRDELEGGARPAGR